MTDWDAACDFMESIGRTSIRISTKELRQMAARLPKASIKGGKVKVPDTAPPHAKAARKAKADRTEKRLRANRDAKR